MWIKTYRYETERNDLNREQQEVLTLLKEIDIICRKNGITYFLSPQLTLCAVGEQPFPVNPMAGVILMKAWDIPRFVKAFEEEQPLRRSLESMENNRNFPGFYLRYCNKNTLCYHMDTWGRLRYPGLGINIQPVQAMCSSRKKYLWNRLREDGWSRICGKNSRWKSVRDLFCICMVRIMSLGGKERLGRKIFSDLTAVQQEGGEYVIRGIKKTSYYPAEIFEKAKEIVLEGERFLVPEDTDGYLSAAYGENYLERPAENYVQSPAMVVSTLIPCEEYLEQTPGLKKLAAERGWQEKLQGYGRCYKKYFNLCWKYAKMCGNRRALGATYVEKKDYIINLHKNGDYMQLERVFRSYTNMMEKCLKQDEVFEADEEILNIYLDVLEKTGRLVFLEKVRNCM